MFSLGVKGLASASGAAIFFFQIVLVKCCSAGEAVEWSIHYLLLLRGLCLLAIFGLIRILGDFRIAGSTSAFTIVISIECHTDWISDYVARRNAHVWKLSRLLRRPRPDPWSASRRFCSLMGQGRKLFGCRRFRVPAFSACSFGTRWGKLGAGRLG